MKLGSKGATHLIIILAVIVVGVVGFAGYYVATTDEHKESSEQTTSQATIPNKFESKNDLEQASKALDADQSDSELDPAQLDEDLNDLL